MKKKIIIAFPSFRGGGAERVMINLARNIDKELFDVYLMVLNDEGSYKKLIPKEIKILNLKSTRLRYALKEMEEAINLVQPDTILTTLSHISLGILSIKRKFIKRPKIIVRLSNTPSQILKKLPIYKRIVFKWLINYFYPKADLIIAQCREMKDDFNNVFNMEQSKTIYIYNPIDIEFIGDSLTNENPFNNEKVNFLSVGRLTQQKGFDILLKSFTKVLDEIPNANLTILGTGELEEDLIGLVDKLKISESVNFLGFTDNPYDYYYYSDVYVLSSRWEGFPNTLLEAIACNTKVVATNCKSGPTEIIGNEYGDLVEVEDIASLSSGMLSSYRNPKKTSDRYKAFEMNKIVKEYEQILY